MNMIKTIPRVRTNYSDTKARDLLIYTSGYSLGSAQVALFWSLFAFEHGAGADKNAPSDGRAVWNCFNNNFGNRRGIVGEAGAYSMTAGEIIGGHEVQVPGIWPAYSTPEIGVGTWLEMMQEHYYRAWSVAASATGALISVASFAAALKAGGYYTASTERYTAGLATWARIYERQYPFRPIPGKLAR